MRRLIFHRRHGRSALHDSLTIAGSIGVALLAGYLFLEASGIDAAGAYRALLVDPLGTSYGFFETLVKAIPLILTGLAVAVAFRMRLWNIGAEGQLYAGALAATYVALFTPDFGLPRAPLMLVAACAAGAVWAAVPGVLRATLGVSEILVTLMGNYVAILVADHLCYGPWKGKTTFGFPMSDRFPDDAALPAFAGTRLHVGLFVGVLCSLALWALLWRTKWGFQVRVAGSNVRAAEYAGYRVKRDAVVVMILSGTLAGMAGGVELSGVLHRLQPRFSPGYGYTAILVAWLARLHPLAVPLVAFLFGVLLTGGEQLQVMGISSSLVDVLQGLILLSVLAADAAANWRMAWVVHQGSALSEGVVHD
ncbi:ABC transporter permease [Candidatus Fermentibacteria bacterium]|nr:ABC transporter permease [Candidatus Fermentibacteria bacterium]